MKKTMKRTMAIVMMAIMLLGFSVPAFAMSSSRSSIEEGTYAIVLHDDQNRCVNVIFASKEEDRAQVGVDPYNSEKNEQFIIRHRGNNYYSIHPVHASNLCLNALLGNRTPGDLLTLHRYENGDQCSLWSFHRYSDGSYAIRNRYTGLVLDVTNGNYDTGNRIINWTSNDYMRAQAFFLNNVNGGSAQTNNTSMREDFSNQGRASIGEGTYAIKLHDDQGRCMNVIFASTEEDKAQLGVDPYNGESNEKFIIRHRGNNYYSIHPVHASNLCLNALLGNKNPGDLLTLHRYENGDNCSLWAFYKRLDGSYTIRNKHTGLAIDVTNGDYTTGNRMINWTNNDYLRAQAFYLVKISSSTAVVTTAWQYPVKNCAITQSFAHKTNSPPTPSRTHHVGIDITSSNKNIYAAASGTVKKTGYNSSNGNYIVLQHSVNGKTVYSFYAHLSKIYVSKGQSVTTKTNIGYMGDTGRSFGTHLHFAICDTYRAGSYVGYVPAFSGNKTTYGGITFYNPEYVIKNGRLP